VFTPFFPGHLVLLAVKSYFFSKVGRFPPPWAFTPFSLGEGFLTFEVQVRATGGGPLGALFFGTPLFFFHSPES